MPDRSIIPTQNDSKLMFKPNISHNTGEFYATEMFRHKHKSHPKSYSLEKKKYQGQFGTKNIHLLLILP